MTTGQENSYNEGVENNGTEVGTITFTVPDNAPETLYYACEFHDTMQGEIEVITREEMSIRKLIVRYLIT
jgi:plastocyanin